MSKRSILFAGVALSAAMAMATTASAAPKKHKAHKAAAPSAEAQEIRELKAEVHDLTARLDSQEAAQRSAVAQAEEAKAAAAAAASQAAAANTQAVAAASEAQASETATAAATKAVPAQIATAIEKEHHNDALYFKGVTVKPGGYLELAGIFREHFQGNDLSSSFSIPFPNNRPAHVSEGRFSARQSRLSLLVEGKVNPSVTLGMYGEFDFLGGAQTANSNQSNSFTPRIRNIYGTIDWNNGDGGFHVLAGQNWSLVTMNNKGITPRNEVTPPQIDAQYVPGFVWARQPQVRLAADFLDHKLWVAVSAENPATLTPAGTVPAVVTNTAPAASGFDSANTLSLNSIPDFVGKVAYEADISGHSLHLEGFALLRDYVAHLNNTGTNNHTQGYGFGGGAILQVVPKVLDAQISGMIGQGIGRYGTSNLPEVSFDAAGNIHAIKEYMLLAGLTLHATKMLDIYGFAGEEVEQPLDLSGGFGLGLITANNSGCFVEGGTCGGNTHSIRQLTVGFWDKIYQGSFGRAQVGIQYSYTERQLFPGTGGLAVGATALAPTANQSMAFLSFRYYPF